MGYFQSKDDSFWKWSVLAHSSGKHCVPSNTSNFMRPINDVNCWALQTTRVNKSFIFRSWMTRIFFLRNNLCVKLEKDVLIFFLCLIFSPEWSWLVLARTFLSFESRSRWTWSTAAGRSRAPPTQSTPSAPSSSSTWPSSATVRRTQTRRA